MSSSPTVVVKKGGVLTAFVSGIFGTLIVCVICAAAVGLYAMNMADRKISDFLSSGKTLLDVVPELRGSLSVVSDALDDRRAPEYREQLDVSVRAMPAPEGALANIAWIQAERAGRLRVPDRGQVAVVEVTNRGPQTVTYLTARIVVADERDVPLTEHSTFIATPIGFNEQDWRGPLLPGSVRRFSVALPDCDASAKLNATIEITDVRVWNQDHPREVAAPTLPPAATAPPASPPPAAPTP